MQLGIATAKPPKRPIIGRASHLRDFVYGSIDGTVTTFAIVAGVAGAGLSTNVIVALGMANILADGFSMAAGNYSGTKTELDDNRRLAAQKIQLIKNEPDKAKSELRAVLSDKGLNNNILEQATNEIAKKPSAWLELLMVEGAGFSPTVPAPFTAAVITFFAFLTAGTLPLLPFILGISNAFGASVVVAGVVFFLIGAAKSRWAIAPWWRSGLETLIIGTIAALIAYVTGSMFHA